MLKARGGVAPSAPASRCGPSACAVAFDAEVHGRRLRGAGEEAGRHQVPETQAAWALVLTGDDAVGTL